MVVVAAAWEASAAWVAARSAAALVDAVGAEPVVRELPLPGQTITDPAREELALALRTSPNAMGTRIDAARGLLAHPDLVALVESAAISAWAARLVVLELADLTGDQAVQVVDHVCARVRGRLAAGRRAWTSAEVGRAARIARRRICPDSDQRTRERAFSRRRVQVMPDRNGMAVLLADLDETDAHRIHRRLTAIARGLTGDGETRSCDQLRADVLVDLILRPPAPAAGTPGTVGAQGTRADEPLPAGPDGPGGAAGVPASGRPEIQVVVSLETLLSISEDPAEIPGLGPISSDLARTLAAEGTWRAWVVDASGAVVATGSRGYVPSAAVARAVRAREPLCRMPGCRQPSLRCDLDHTVPYPRGATSPANLGPLCRRHHVLKTHAGWQLEPDPSPGQVPQPDQVAPVSDHPHPGRADPAGPPGWRWRTPAGFTVSDQPTPPLE